MKLPPTIDLVPELLFRLRDAHNGSIERIVEKSGHTREEILGWEKTGKEVPSKILKWYQSEYKKPIAFFLLPELTKINLKPLKTRTHKNVPQEDFTKDTLLEIEKISQRVELLENLELLTDDKEIFGNLLFNLNPKKYSRDVRSFLKISDKPAKTKKWLQYWIDHIEQTGLHISQTELQDKLDGFLATSQTGHTTIVLGTGDPETRRLFTLAHELGHFLIQKHGVRLTYQVEETFCNKFAGNLLFPSDLLKNNQDIKNYLANKFSDEYLYSCAKSFGVSPEVVLRRLLDEKISPQIDNEFYLTWKKRYEEKGGDYKKKSGGGGPLTYYYTTYNKLGHRTSKLLLKARSGGLIDTPTLVSRTGIKAKNIKKFSDIVVSA